MQKEEERAPPPLEREASLEKHLKCPLCLELLSRPVLILPCQHNLCRKCATRLYQPSLFQARTTMTVSSGRFRCPSCNQEVVLDRHGVHGLQRNLLVENIIDIYKQEVAGGGLPASPAPLPPQGQLSCADHEGEKLNIYCLSCQTPTCSLCKVFGAHQGCEVEPLTDVCQRRKDELSEGVSALSCYNSKLQAVIDELEQTCRTIQENRRLQEQHVTEKFSRIVSVLQERQKAMTQRISSAEEERTGHAQSLARCYGNSMEENNKLMERARRRLEEPDMAAFVQNSRELITKVLAASTSCSFGTLKPGFEDLKLHRCDFREQEEALRSVDFFKVLEESPGEPGTVGSCEELKDLPVKDLPEHEPGVEVSLQSIGSVTEPSNESLPVLTVTPVEPVEPVTPNPAVLSALLMDSEQDQEEDQEEVLTGPEEQNFAEVPSARDEEQSEPLACAAARAQEDGMSTQQAVTLLFYVLAFLVLLQRVWTYISCFICT